MRHVTRTKMLLAALLLSAPSISEAGPPLICHPFQTARAELLPWGTGEGWNTPDRSYDVQRLPADMLRLLTADAPVLARMETMRRAAIYAAQDGRVADQLLQALLTRATGTSGRGAPTAIFDAGYLIESYKQATHLHRRPAPPHDGYAMVVRAIATSGGNAEMEFAASLMTQGAQADAHLRRARAAASTRPLLAQNIHSVWR